MTWILWLLEFVGFAPSGTCRTAMELAAAADDLVGGGRGLIGHFHTHVFDGCKKAWLLESGNVQLVFYLMNKSRSLISETMYQLTVLHSSLSSKVG